MPLDPKYAAYMQPTFEKSDKHPSILKQEVGESFVGVVTFVGEPFEKKNDRYVAEVRSSDGQIITEAEGKPITTTMKVNIILQKITTIGDDGMVTEEKNEPRTVWVQKWGQFKSIGEACVDAGVDDLQVGWTWGLKRVKGDPKSNAHVFKSKLIAPSE